MANAAVRATDGAVWQATAKGLVRIEGDTSTVVAEDMGAYTRVPLAAGDGGSVWAIVDGDVVRVRPDGSRTSIGRPPGSRRLFEGTPLAAGHGVVWTTDSDPKRGVVRLDRWDGRWSTVGVPEPYTWASQLLVAEDGAVWGTLDGEDVGQALARYADGEWTIEQGAARGLAQTPSGEVCTIRDTGVTCYDAAGVAAGAPVSTYPLEVGALGIGSDGSAWVLGEQVARLPEGATGVSG
jgi:ligand-binding sensor domain-containing protein